MTRQLWWAAGALAAAALGAAAQSGPEQATIEVAATSRAGIATGLGAKDFRVWEENKEQPVTAATAEGPGKRALVLLFDNTTLPVSRLGDLRGYVSNFIDSLRGTPEAPELYLEVATLRPGVSVLQPFTTDAELLKTALTGAAANAGVNPATTGVASASTATAPASGSRASGGGRGGGRGGGAGNSAEAQGTTLKSQEKMESLRALVRSLAAVKGRKAVLYFTGGDDFTPDGMAEYNAAMEAANEANVAIYCISDNFAFAKTVAEATGATAYKVTQSLPAELREIAREQENEYAVTFTTASGGDPAGACHAVRVKAVAAGVEARARRTYCAAKQADALAGTAAGKELDERLAGAAAGNLGAEVQAPYFEGSGTLARVAVVLDASGSGVVFHKEKGKLRGELRVAGGAYREDGSAAAHFSETVAFEFAEQRQADAFAKVPYHYEHEIELPPGQYTVKAALEASPEAWGKAERTVTIAPYDAGQFGMSAIALSHEMRSIAGGTAGLGADMLEGQTPLVASGREIVPTAVMRFARNEHALFYLEVYEPSLAGSKPAGVSVDFRIVERKTGAPRFDSGPASLAGYMRPGNRVIAVASTLPVEKLNPGQYRLEILASHTTGRETAVRSVDFDLE